MGGGGGGGAPVRLPQVAQAGPMDVGLVKPSGSCDPKGSPDSVKPEGSKRFLEGNPLSKKEWKGRSGKKSSLGK